MFNIPNHKHRPMEYDTRRHNNLSIYIRCYIARRRRRSRLSMLDKVSKISLDHCVLDAKRTMQKYTPVFRQQIINET